MYIPHQTGRLQLTQLANRFLNNEEKLPYSFYVFGEELLVPIGTYIEQRNVSMEKILMIVYRQQAVFRTRPISRISATIAGHEDSVLCVSFSPDGNQLASGSGDTTVRLWDLNTQTPMFTCRGHRNWVMCIAWSPDGKHLVSGSKAGEVCCWIPKTGELDGKPLMGHKKWITSISWEPVHLNYPCRRFVTSSKDGDARIWDITLRKCVASHWTYKLCYLCQMGWGWNHIYRFSRLYNNVVGRFSGGSSTFEVTIEDYVLRTGSFDHTGKQYSSPEEVRKAALKRYNQAKGMSGERLVSGSDDFTVVLWEQSVSNKPKKHLLGHPQPVNHVCFSPNGQWIASASFDRSIRIWDGITGDFITTLRGHVGRVYQISWSPDSRMLLSGSRDSTLKVWDIGLRKLKQNLPGHEDEVYAVDWSPDGERVVSGGKDKCLKLWVG
ncbi:unnamed protein product [Arabis nemorensis]|uniref:NLE domain-containing protein n=1 Tax=Arabis nemorensis TaxID=586526 RepID=A0A565CB40_9BRAS|nr:unnamed protein product [Arabis nemorensis]